jgi:hypothetical protein
VKPGELARLRGKQKVLIEQGLHGPWFVRWADKEEVHEVPSEEKVKEILKKAAVQGRPGPQVWRPVSYRVTAPTGVEVLIDPVKP